LSIKTKFELIDSLPDGGIAIFNYANSDCWEMAIRAKNLKKDLQIYGYFLENGKPGPQADLKAKVLTASTKGIEFAVEEKEKRIKLLAPLPGAHLLENLLAAILVARIFKVSWEEIAQECLNLKLPAKTMKVWKLKNKAILIDDSFNTNPQGFKAAVNFLKHFKDQKKAVITSGIIELGEKSNETHENLGKLISQVAEEIILTNQDFAASLKTGLGEKSSLLRVIPNIKILKQEFKNLIESKYVILMEGRMPKILEETLKEYQK